jgi:hypothetical protein
MGNERIRRAHEKELAARNERELAARNEREQQWLPAELRRAVEWYGEAMKESSKQLVAWLAIGNQERIAQARYQEARRNEDEAKNAFYRALRKAHDIPEPDGTTEEQ